MSSILQFLRRRRVGATCRAARAGWFAWAAMLALDTRADETPEPAAPETAALHAQVTNVTQWHRRFQAPYSGQNSLVADGRTEETTDVTLYAGIRPWRGAELWVNPEIDQGFGLSNTVGVAGFPSGEAYKIGADAPYLRVPRAFLRQTIDLGGPDLPGERGEPVESAANQLAGTLAPRRLTLTLGKFSVTDIFDTNSDAHDPRADFLNWSVIDAGVFDYAADPWGFTNGGALEFSSGAWTVRGGVFELSSVPNGKITSVDFSRTMSVAEVEHRGSWQGQPGKVKLLVFANHGRMADYGDAVRLAEAAADTPDVALVRRRATRTGATVNVEQALADDLGLFARAGVNDGRKEAYEFTEINRTVSAGLSLHGARWGRPDDAFGLAGVVNGLSADARSYFAAGGIGILIGDGRLRYGAEEIVEATYSLALRRHLALSADVQRIEHPAYNRDRGPVTVWAMRAHAEF